MISHPRSFLKQCSLSPQTFRGTLQERRAFPGPEEVPPAQTDFQLLENERGSAKKQHPITQNDQASSSKRLPDSDWKADFPLLSRSKPGLVYLDSAATTHKPHPVLHAMADFYAMHYATVHRAVYSGAVHATELHHSVREKVRAFLNAEFSEEVVFTKGTTESINLVASCFGRRFLGPGDEVVIPEIEHHSNLVPWQMVCKQQGANLRACRVNDKGEIDPIHLRQLLSSGRVKLVACAHMSNVLGTIHPIRTIADLAHRSGARLLVDGAQMAAHGSVDVQSLGADFYAFSGHKVYGPTGVGVLYGRRDLLRAMPPYQGGGDMIAEVTLDAAVYQEPPLKFEAGTPPIAEVVGLGAALDYLKGRGLADIARREADLTHYALQRLAEIPGIRVLGDPKFRGPIISFVVDGVHHLDMGTLLDLKGIAVRTGHHCCQTAMTRFNVPGTVRVSFGMYNTHEDVDALTTALRRILTDLKPSQQSHSSPDIVVAPG